MDRPIGDLRKEYTLRGLTEKEANADPLRQFDLWFDEAVKANLSEPNAAALATVDTSNHPTVRIVLLKGYDDRGFVFYTDYRSRKGLELDHNPHAGLCLWWAEMERQVRVDGRVEKISPDESDVYFASRPRASQLGAWASDQSQLLPGREPLETRLAEVEKRFADSVVPRPPNWGGYRLIPESIEFWQGRPQRLHDRLLYSRKPGGGWQMVRLSP